MSQSISFHHKGRVLIAILLFLIFFFASCPASGQGRVYWTEPATTTVQSIGAQSHN